MSVAGDGISPASRFDDDLRPENASRDVDRSDLGDGNTFFVGTEQPRFRADHPLRADNDPGRKKEIAAGPARGSKRLRRRRIHGSEISRGHSIQTNAPVPKY